MEALLSILTSTAAGGIIGVVGSWLTKREERKNIQLQFERDVKLAEIRKDEAKIEADHELALADKQIERAQVEGSVAIDQAEIEAFTHGLKEQSKNYGIKVVDGIRGLMRPLITVYLLVIATLLTLKINQLVGGLDSLEMSELKGIYDNVINQMLFLTATAVTWWFGSRPSSQRRD
jgi:hypothetical protein